MKSKLELTNRATGDKRIVDLVTWEYMRRDGRSKYWTPEVLNEPKKAEKPAKKEKEEIKIEPININETENEDGAN